MGLFFFGAENSLPINSSKPSTARPNPSIVPKVYVQSANGSAKINRSSKAARAVRPRAINKPVPIRLFAKHLQV